MKHLFKISFFLFALVFITGATAQTTIWSEDFETGYSDNDLTAQDNNLPAGADWTVTGTATSKTVNDNGSPNGVYQYRIQGDDNTVIWTTEVITITGYTNVSMSAVLQEAGTLEADDCIDTEYSLDGGAYINFATNGTVRLLILLSIFPCMTPEEELHYFILII